MSANTDRDHIARMSAAQHRQWYSDLYSTYLSHPPDSKEANNLHRQMEGLLSFGKISTQEAAGIRLFIESAHEEAKKMLREAQREEQEETWSKRLGMKLRLDYSRGRH